ncbi:MAG: quinone-dependent dihydroorotate dehydrogenase [Kordiimonadaceae bacterium]|nr:quinone-dependent dihydroorotate dehydrogenase [Kordiimonadaceae bacterium]
MALDVFPLAKPFLHLMSTERAHQITIAALKAGAASILGATKDPASLHTEVFGLSFSNPIGMAAGFDKNADVIVPTHRLGFGFAEAGTVTPLAQPGNEKPRLFRLKEDAAVINRLGFNNKGLESFSAKLRRLTPGGNPFGANVGANKTTEDKTADYVTGIETLYGLSDYFTVNISSPNTPGLRALQSKKALSDLVARVLSTRDKKMAEGHRRVPILVKIAPDMTRQDLTDIADIAVETDIDGLIVSNTTITRPASLTSANKEEIGGLSGQPLMALSTKALSNMYQATGGKVPLIGVGGVSSGADAYAKIRAGASLVQLYSALIYKGPALIGHIKADLATLLEKDGFTTVADAVGADHT